MKMSRNDIGALTTVVVSGVIGFALFGPHRWGDDSKITIDVTTEMTAHSMIDADGGEALVIKKKKIRRGDGTQEIVVTVEGDDDEHRERRVRVKSSEAQGEPNVFLLRADGENAPQPLVYVDGERMEGGIPENLDPDRIDRVEVIKGEAAVALYGPEASVGVVQIFTKDGPGSE
jgi:outer membrane receptor for ferrienterochelin and colicin